MKRFYLIFAIVGILLICDHPAHALVLLPSADGGILDGYVYNVGFVSKDGIPDQVDPSQSVQVLNDSQVEERGIIEFDTAAFNEPLTSAYLKLYTIDQRGPYPLNFDMYAYQGNNNLDAADYNDGSLLTSFTYSGEQSLTFDVTDFVKNMKTANTNDIGFNLRLLDVSPNGPNVPYVAFGSLENPQSAQLFLNGNSGVVPEPATILLLGAGLVGTFLKKRKT